MNRGLAAIGVGFWFLAGGSYLANLLGNQVIKIFGTSSYDPNILWFIQNSPWIFFLIGLVCLILVIKF